jgi:hypothetical protein
MHGPPSIADLVRAVRTFFEAQVLPELHGPVRQEARAAVHLLGIAERELELAPPRDERERERLAALLGRSGNLEELTRDLCRRIRSRELRIDTPGLADHLWRVALDSLDVDQPHYLRDRRAPPAPGD